MSWSEMVRVAVEGIWVNKLRSGLTVLGIIIGVTAVIIVVTLGQGGQDKIMSELESMGSNLFMIYCSGQSDDADWERYKITAEEVRIIRESVEGIRGLVPVTYAYPTLQSQRKKETSRLIGTEADFAKIHNLHMAKGRFFNTSDNAAGRRVIVINSKLADNLFGSGSDVIGRTLIVNQNPVVVCGVVKSESSFFEGGAESTVAYIPVNLYLSMYGSSGIYELDGSATSKDRVDKVADKVVKALEVRHGIKDKKVYQSFNMEEQVQSANKITGILTMIIGCIAGISLLVGGIGVMNIMLVSVTERTREIGIRMAIGARRRDIMVQFLIEAVVLSLLGGAVGIILGLAGGAAVCAAVKMPFKVSVSTILLAFSFCSAVGIFFGLYPANRAARLDPIEALRYE